MRVALDVQALQVEGWADRGVGRYVAGYSLALHRQKVLGAALLAPELPPPAGLPVEIVASGVAAWDTSAVCREMISGTEPVVYHVTAPFLHCAPGDPAALGVSEHWSSAGVPRAVLLHDLIPLRAPTHYLPNPAHELRYRTRAEWVAGADLVLTNSGHTRSEAINLLGCDDARAVAVGAGVSSFFRPPDGTDEELWRFHFEDLAGAPFFLVVGGSDARKGTERAIEALGQLIVEGFDLRLVVAGHLTAEWRLALTRLAAACGVGDKVVLAGGLSDEVLRACYRRAEVTVMPSLAEGAGLPILESAACGCPALASDSTALAETASTRAALFDPTDVGSMSDAIARVLEDGRLRTAILAAQARLAAESTWDAVGRRAAVALERLASSSGRTAVPRPRLALVAGTDDTAIDAIARSLQAHFETDVVSPPALGTDIRAAAYDHVVYTSGSWRLPCATGWFWLRGEEPACTPARLAPFARGFLVGSEEARQWVEDQLPPLAAHPPVMVLEGEVGASLAAAVGTV